MSAKRQDALKLINQQREHIQQTEAELAAAVSMLKRYSVLQSSDHFFCLMCAGEPLPRFGSDFKSASDFRHSDDCELTRLIARIGT